MIDPEMLEEELRKSLRHVPAPDGFADRVMARAHAGRTRRRLPSPGVGWWMSIAAAVLLAVGAEGVHVKRVHDAEEAGAQAQLELAMELTQHALDEVQQNVNRSPAGRYTRVLQDDAAQGGTR